MKRIRIIATALVAVFCVCTASAQTAVDVAEKYNKGVKIINEDKNYPAAAPIMEEVIKEGTAIGAGSANEVANAKKYIPQLYYNIGLDLAKKKDFAAAEANFSKAHAKAKEYNDQTMLKKAEVMLGNTYLAQAGAFIKTKEYAKAAEIYKQGMKAQPNNTTLELQLAISYVESGQKDQGYAALNHIIEKAKTNPTYKNVADKAKATMENYDNVEVNKAIAARNYPKAVSLISVILKNNPNNATAQMMLIQAYNNMEKYDDVISKGPAAAAAQSDANNKSDIYYMIGLAYYNKQQNDKALENFKKVLKGNSVSLAKERITELSTK